MVEAGAQQGRESGLTQGIARLRKWDGIGILIALLILTTLLSVTAPAFLSQYNLSVVARQASFVGLIALGQTLVLLIGGVIGVLFFLMNKDMSIAFYGFFASFMLLFFATGVGNASTFQMIPSIMRQEVPRLMPNLDEAATLKQSERESAAIIAFTSAIAAYGAFFIPKLYGTSIAMTGAPNGALWAFMAFYAVCTVVCWMFYSRKSAPVPC